MGAVAGVIDVYVGSDFTVDAGLCGDDVSWV